MQNLDVSLDTVSLLEILKSYYNLSKIKTAVYNAKGNCLLAYPLNDCAFCQLMKENDETRKLCEQSDKKSFEIVKEKKELIVYHCHANLIEASFPIIQDEVVLGYIMFGQITDNNDKNKFYEDMGELLNMYGFSKESKSKISSIKHRTSEQIKAAAKLLEVCTSYVLLKQFIKLSNKDFYEQLNAYIDANIDKNISVDDLINFFGVSKNKLYTMFNSYNEMGIAKYIKNYKIKKAKELLVNTKMKVKEIAIKVGYTDYNYFCRTFKQSTKMSCNQYREMMH